MRKFITVLLPCATLLAMPTGCASSSNESGHMTESRREAAVVSRETRDPTRASQAAYVQPGQAAPAPTAYTAVPPTPYVPAETDRNGVAEQQARVTLTSTTAPPVTRPELLPRTLHEDEFWVGGNWRAETGQFVWESGRIEQHRAGRLFVPGNWVAADNSWEFSPEYWR